jgi:lipid-binding SYLF domain-containing protein
MLVGLFVIPAAAQQDSRDEAREATNLLDKVMANKGKAIPRSLLKRAQAIAIFTNVKKGGFIIGGTGGDGVIARRTGKTWGPPVFYKIGGANVGLQIGVKNGDIIALFMTQEALDDLLDDEFEMTAGIGATAGPVGDESGVSTGKNSNVYVYANSSGAFAGATIGGGTIRADNDRNEDLYKMKGGAVLRDSSSINIKKLPAELQTFTRTLNKYIN